MSDTRVDDLVAAADLQAEATLGLTDLVRALVIVNAIVLDLVRDRIDIDTVRRKALLSVADEGPASGVAQAVLTIVGSAEAESIISTPDRIILPRLN